MKEKNRITSREVEIEGEGVKVRKEKMDEGKSE
jgi:hypothetical protein